MISPSIPIRKITLSVWIVALFLGWVIRVAILTPILQTFNLSPDGEQLIGDMLRFIIWVLPVLLYLGLYKRQNLIKALKLVPPISGYRIVIGFTAFLVIQLILKAQNGLVIETNKHLIVWWFTLFLTPLLEEILFRGFLLPAFELYGSKIKANLVQAILFMLIHFYWLVTDGFTLDVVARFATVFVIGLILGYVTQRSHSLLPAIWLHTLNNLVSLIN